MHFDRSLPIFSTNAMTPAARFHRTVLASACAAAVSALMVCGTAQADTMAADALPANAQLQHGAVKMHQASDGLLIKQTSDRAVIDWQTFDIGEKASVRVVQPNAQAALLNRVTGSSDSTIAGNLQANGQVYLINPNGITVTPDGTVQAAGFVASTLDIRNVDFTEGNLKFAAGDVSSTAGVIHRGRIHTDSEGFVALLGQHVDQAGTVSTPLGRAAFGAGSRATLDPSGDGFLQIVLPEGPSPGATLWHGGVTEAPGGRVELVALNTVYAGKAIHEAVNLSGLIDAPSSQFAIGRIGINAAGGVATLTGVLSASSESREDYGVGGSIEVSALRVVMEKGQVLANGAMGGGNVLIGSVDAAIVAAVPQASDRHSTIVEVPVAGYLTSPLTHVGALAEVGASATYHGNGGTVKILSDGRTEFAGLVHARGAAPAFDAADADMPMTLTTPAADRPHHAAM